MRETIETMLAEIRELRDKSEHHALLAEQIDAGCTTRGDFTRQGNPASFHPSALREMNLSDMHSNAAYELRAELRDILRKFSAARHAA